ncbi:MAG: hypothetical protein KF746_12610 [Chitinophagaceae bacterium]|nr:hypothetical protein [Chitinophagaceae bacterium]
MPFIKPASDTTSIPFLIARSSGEGVTTKLCLGAMSLMAIWLPLESVGE